MNAFLTIGGTNRVRNCPLRRLRRHLSQWERQEALMDAGNRRWSENVGADAPGGPKGFRLQRRQRPPLTRGLAFARNEQMTGGEKKFGFLHNSEALSTSLPPSRLTASHLPRKPGGSGRVFWRAVGSAVPYDGGTNDSLRSRRAFSAIRAVGRFRNQPEGRPVRRRSCKGPGWDTAPPVPQETVPAASCARFRQFPPRSSG